MNNKCICTIISNNYLAYAKTLIDSILQHHNDVDIYLLIVDEPNEVIEQKLAEILTSTKVVYCKSLGLADFDTIAYKYDILELNTALKPTFLKFLFSKGYKSIVYLDPDIKLFSNLGLLFEILNNHQIVLTPHAVSPVLDGARPSDIDFLRNGVFNFGFIALSEGKEAMSMLEWWESRCLYFGFNDPAFGIFVDQKWGNLIPCYFNSVYILKDHGYNVAYWNLHDKQLTIENDRIIVNGHPLVFFHFSGVDYKNTMSLSKYQTRFDLKANYVLRQLIENYCAELTKNHHSEFVKLPYSYAKLNDGTIISKLMRRAYVHKEHNDSGSTFDSRSPFQASLKRLRQRESTTNTSDHKVNVLNFNQDDKRIRLVNGFIRLMCISFGVERVALLIKYFAFLDRESHLSSVLLNKKFHLIHKIPD